MTLPPGTFALHPYAEPPLAAGTYVVGGTVTGMPGPVQPMTARVDDFEAFRPAYPTGHLDRVEADVLEAVPAHLIGSPPGGRIEVLRTAEAVSEGVSELREALPGEGRRA